MAKTEGILSVRSPHELHFVESIDGVPQNETYREWKITGDINQFIYVRQNELKKEGWSLVKSPDAKSGPVWTYVKD